jgi:hypothetical protein
VIVFFVVGVAPQLSVAQTVGLECQGSPAAGFPDRSLYESARKRVEKGALFQFAVESYGAFLKCQWRLGNLQYVFAKGVVLTAEADEKIEAYSVQIDHVVVKQPVAMDVLKRIEATWFEGAKCEIDWQRPERMKSNQGFLDLHFRGEVCHCSGHLRLRGDNVVRIGFSSAC